MKRQWQVVWTAERVAKLADDEVRNLHANATALGDAAISNLCAAELAGRSRRLQPRARRGTPKAKPSFSIKPTAVEGLAREIIALPPVDEVGNGLARLRRQATPVTSLDELWRQFIICGFSSRENSEEDSPLGRFVQANGPLLDLSAVAAHGADPTWAERELRTYGLSLWRRDVALLAGAYGWFMEAGGPGGRLVDACRDGGGLKLFCDLARGDVSDQDLASSKAFSAGINISVFPYIKHKQIRNILVNTGLAHNVVPLDSRWQKFFGAWITTTKSTFSSQTHYLAIEDVLRQALLSIRAQRPDLNNLAVLDAVVFAQMSSRGIGKEGWLGPHLGAVEDNEGTAHLSQRAAAV